MGAGIWGVACLPTSWYM